MASRSITECAEAVHDKAGQQAGSGPKRCRNPAPSPVSHGCRVVSDQIRLTAVLPSPPSVLPRYWLHSSSSLTWLVVCRYYTLWYAYCAISYCPGSLIRLPLFFQGTPLPVAIRSLPLQGIIPLGARSLSKWLKYYSYRLTRFSPAQSVHTFYHIPRYSSRLTSTFWAQTSQCSSISGMWLPISNTFLCLNVLLETLRVLHTLVP